jgi:hypothetical protein
MSPNREIPTEKSIHLSSLAAVGPMAHTKELGKRPILCYLERGRDKWDSA